MNVFVKNLGVIVLLIGVALLAVPAMTGKMTNTVLLAGLGTMLIGYFGHILINKKAE